MKVLVVGGGSGGHITPAVATLRELLLMRPRVRAEFWTDRKYYKNVHGLLSYERMPYSIRVRKVAAGKFHRYAGWSFADYFRHFDVTVKDLIAGNILGFLGFVSGLVQSFVRLAPRARRPDVIFLKGGFVGLPVGMVARVLGIPYVVHESDTVPGLANRLLMKRATVIATGFNLVDNDSSPAHSGLPSGHCSQDKNRCQSVEWVGIPVAPEFKPVSEARQRSLKKAFGFDAERPLVVVTGGSQGAQALNEAMREILPEVLKFASVGLVAGRKHYEEIVDLKRYEDWEKAELKSNFRMWEFCSVMDELMGAADVVVSRAGATTVAELARLAKAVVLVPFERLPGGHQVKNAERLGAAGAAKVILNGELEQKPNLLLDELRHLVRSPKEREALAGKMAEQAKPEAAKRLAEILLEVAKGGGVRVAGSGGVAGNAEADGDAGGGKK